VFCSIKHKSNVWSNGKLPTFECLPNENQNTWLTELNINL